MQARILIVDSEPAIGSKLQQLLAASGYAAENVDSVTFARQRLQTQIFDVVLADPRVKDEQGLDVPGLCQRLDPGLPVLLMVAFMTYSTATPDAGRLRNTVARPARRDDLLAAIERALESSRLQRESRQLRERLGIGPSFQSIVGRDAKLLEQIERARVLANSDLPVLICGESGTGKELMAQAIHAASPRRDRPLVVAFLSAEPQDLQLSALFGHVAGAFTGAVTSRHGWFRESHLGSLFLDEVGDIVAGTQVALLRALDQKVVKVIGENTEHRIDTRIISATNSDLPSQIRAGRFRRDLYQRLGGDDCITIPPLRERPGDLPLLVDHFVRSTTRAQQPVPACSDETLSALAAYDWPGNIRELRYKVELAVLRSAGEPLRPDHFQLPARQAGSRPAPGPESGLFDLPLKDAQAQFTDVYLERLMSECEGNKSEVARRAGVDVSTIRRWLRDRPGPQS